MMSLAEYLTEFPEENGKPFQNLKAPKPKREKPTFEHLTLVSSQVAKKKKKKVPESLAAIPDMSEAEDALDKVEFDAADFGFDNAAEAPEAFAAPEPAITAEDVEAARAEGHEAGREEAMQELEQRVAAAVEEALAAEREKAAAAQAEAVEQARLDALAEEGARLGEVLTERLDRVETALRTSFFGVVKPLVVDVRMRQTMEDLAAAVATLAVDGRALSLQAVGPAALLDAFSEALGERRGFVAFEADETMGDIRIVCDQTTLETRLGQWKTALEEALQ
ncbi:hypothetical protein [Jiella marina]|uniref:hypothetical protein n=1 Tax=Jiella sp. LLJ827 TaxID=2917712 RepID=UPI0021018CD5|nr:hypothetical protein [Jiella sp. LLJ827]MCQ0988154.1 hypothetical protein [Jiella sp. LLJ827]